MVWVLVLTYSFIHQIFIEHLYVPATVLDARDTVVTETDKALPSCSGHSS